jgi:hypothetical protein
MRAVASGTLRTRIVAIGGAPAQWSGNASIVRLAVGSYAVGRYGPVIDAKGVPGLETTN